MKSKGWVLGVILLFFFSLPAVSTQKQTAAPGQVLKDLLCLIGKAAQAIKPEALESLAKQIEIDNALLSSSFQAGNFQAMIDLYVERLGVLSTENFEIIYGQDSSAFWKKTRAEGKTLSFKLVSVYVSGPPEGTTIRSGVKNAVAFVVSEIHIMEKSKDGSILHNETFHQSLAYSHCENCPWVAKCPKK